MSMESWMNASVYEFVELNRISKNFFFSAYVNGISNGKIKGTPKK